MFWGKWRVVWSGEDYSGVTWSPNVHQRILMEDIPFYFFTIIVYHLDEVQNCAS